MNETRFGPKKKSSPIYLSPKKSLLMHWMSVKLPDNFQMREHSWPCWFHINTMIWSEADFTWGHLTCYRYRYTRKTIKVAVIYDRLTSIFFTHRNHAWGLINNQILHYEPIYCPSKQVFDDHNIYFCVKAQIRGCHRERGWNQQIMMLENGRLYHSM